jgi:hypothetical protein
MLVASIKVRPPGTPTSRDDIMPVEVKDPHTGINPLDLASGHGHCTSATATQVRPPEYLIRISIATPITPALKNYYI